MKNVKLHNDNLNLLNMCKHTSNIKLNNIFNF